MIIPLLEWTLLVAVVAATLVTLGYALATGVPPSPSSAAEARAVVALLREAGLPTRARIYELGCGFGGLAVAIARAFPESSVVGIELSPVPWLVARLRARRLPNLAVVRGDLLRTRLDDADAVTCYLMIAPMVPLAARLDAALRPGTPVVALAFLFRDRVPERVAMGHGTRIADAALYRWPARGDRLRAERTS